jgi:hypothetical protein
VEVVIDVNQRHSRVFVALEIEGPLRPDKGIGLWELVAKRAPSEQIVETVIPWERDAISSHLADLAGLISTHAKDIIEGDTSVIPSIAAERQPLDS